jgi:hypothetical protein
MIPQIQPIIGGLIHFNLTIMNSENCLHFKSSNSITARVVTDSLKPITSQPYDRHFKAEGFINKCRVSTKPTLIFAHDEREVDSWW